MTPERWRTVKAILEGALELQGEERRAHLDRAAGGDPLLRREVEELLAGEGAEALLTAAAASAVVAGADGPAEVGGRVGPYRLEAEVGRGGMGSVFLARRVDGQYDARVAVKLMRPGLDGERAAARFRLERQYLAALEHPFIARLLDGGVTEDGRLYLVMEFVDGEPIDEFCAARALDLPGRVRLLREVCAAVDYAHRRLIVHRDLKPSNVLVGADGTPKLVDFGIAKLLRADAPADATQDLGRYLTPGYASPEQRAGAPVTTASDVYSLGVILHQLLCGCLPRFAEGAGSAGWATDPLPVSVVALAAGARPGEHAVDPRALRGDLDCIVARALRADPADRYPTAAALDEDLRRYLGGEPVHARRATLAYRARKFARRHVAGVAMTAALTLSLATGAALYAMQARTTARARDAAARRGQFLEEVLRSANPMGGRRDVTVAEVLDASEAQLERERGEDPLVAASLLEVLAETDRDLGRYPQAIAACDRAISLLRAQGGDRKGLADALTTRGDALWNSGRFPEAEASLREALAALARGSGSGQRLARAHHLLGLVLKHAGREKEAEDEYRTSIALYGAEGGADGKIAYPMSDLSVLLGEQGHYAEGSALATEAMSILSLRLPPDHPDILSFELTEAGALMGLHAPAQAEDHIRHVVEARARVLGPTHKETLDAVLQLVDCLTDQGRYAEAAELGRPAAEGLERLLGFEHDITLYGWNVYATAACQTDQAGAGLEALRRVVAAREKLYGPGDWHAESTRVAIGTCLLTLGRLPEAESTLLGAARALEAARGAGFHRTQAAYQALRDVCERQGRADEAARWAARIVPAF